MLFFQNEWGVRELATAERRVRDIHSQIERQHQFIDELAQDGHDCTSAKIVFDSLQVSLSLSLQDRQRLRTTLNVEGARW